MKIQQLVRSLPGFEWRKGVSVCYRDTSYTKTKKKIRFNFDYVRIEDLVAFRNAISEALVDDGH